MTISMVSALDADGTLAALWSPGFDEMALLNSKPANAKLGVAVQLMFYRASGRFSLAASEFPDAAIAFLADQIGAPIADITAYDWHGSSGRRHRAKILAYLGLSRARHPDMRDAAAWTGSELPAAQSVVGADRAGATWAAHSMRRLN